MLPIARQLLHGRYMAFTTFRRSGEGVMTPVWLADLGDGTVGFTTQAGSGKVRRLAANPNVRVSPCSMRGIVPSGAPSWSATATVVRGDDFERVRRAVSRRYGIQLWAITLLDRIRRRDAEEVGVIVVFPDTPTATSGTTGDPG